MGGDHSTPLIAIDNLSKVYGEKGEDQVVALEGISLKIYAGEFVTVLGPSGCGKSTMLMLIAGLYKPTTGAVRINDENVYKPRTDIGFVFQNAVLLDWRTVLGNVMLQVTARKLDKKAYELRAHELLESVGLSEFEDSYPYALSGGMKQRVSICRALVHDPPLLLMDEPFGALDAFTREQLMVDLQRMWINTRKTIVFVTHSITEAIFQSDRIIVMSPRPGHVDRVWDIDLPRPRRLKMVESAEFARYTREIRELFMSRGVIAED